MVSVSRCCVWISDAKKAARVIPPGKNTEGCDSLLRDLPDQDQTPDSPHVFCKRVEVKIRLREMMTKAVSRQSALQRLCKTSHTDTYQKAMIDRNFVLLESLFSLCLG